MSAGRVPGRGRAGMPEATAVNLNPRVWFSRVWNEDARPPGMDEWSEDQITMFADMLEAEPWEIAAAIHRPLREVIWFQHCVASDLAWAEGPA